MRATVLAFALLGALATTGGVASAECVGFGGIVLTPEPSVTVGSVSVSPKDCIGPRE